MADRLSYPPMYHISEPVSVCVVGYEKRPLKTSTDAFQLPLSIPVVHKNADDYIKETSCWVQFGEDVLREQGYHLLPYNPNYLKDFTDPAGLFSTKRKSQINKNRACMQRQTVLTVRQNSAKLEPIITEKHKETNERQAEKPKCAKQGKKHGVPLTETSAEAEKSVGPGAEIKQWDEYVMSILSENTAHWIVRGKMSPGEHYDRLVKFLQLKYGSRDEDVGKELVEDVISEVDFSLKTIPARSRRYKRNDEMMLEKVKEILQNQERRRSTPGGDELSTAFHQLSASQRLSSESTISKSPGAVNQSARNVKVTPYRPPSPPTLRDLLNPKVGDKYYHSKSQYVQDWLTGGKNVHQKDPDKIRTDSDNVYRKKLREDLPHRSTEWLKNDGENSAKKTHSQPVLEKHKKGFRRWKTFPEKIEDFGGGSHPKPVAKESSKGLGEKSVPLETTMTGILKEWRLQWHLDSHYAEVSVDDLIRGMADIHVNNRLKAIATCSRAAEYRRTDGKVKMDGQRLLPEELFVALVLCLQDGTDRVRTAAAVTLYALERPLLEAEEVLRKALRGDEQLDRWTAARCLAHKGGCDFDIVGELVDQLFNTDDQERRCQATDHLVQLSQLSTLVHSMVGEKLNSSSWIQRQTACKTISLLQGDINQDLIKKLGHVMWNDWRKEVRRAAAQTLGKTSHGVDIHNQLTEKLLNGDERAKLDAMSKLSDLGLMTGKLFPIFLKCFDDSNSSLRMEACVACMNLRLMNNEQVLARLVALAANDRAWKVKSLALQALGCSGVTTEEIRKTVLWAFCYGTEEGVRAEACRTITALQLRGENITQVLQDRYLVERSDLVKREIIRALTIYGISPSKDMPIMEQIKDEVRRLGTSENIQHHILANEAEEDHGKNKRRMIYLNPTHVKDHLTLSTKPKESFPPSQRASFIIHHSSNDISDDSSDSEESLSDEEDNDIVTSHIEASTPSFFKDCLVVPKERGSASSLPSGHKNSSSSSAMVRRRCSGKSIFQGDAGLDEEAVSKSGTLAAVPGGSSDCEENGHDGERRSGVTSWSGVAFDDRDTTGNHGDVNDVRSASGGVEMTKSLSCTREADSVEEMGKSEGTEEERTEEDEKEDAGLRQSGQVVSEAVADQVKADEARPDVSSDDDSFIY